MSEEKKEVEVDVNVESDDFKAGYRQGYLDGMEAMADKVIEKLHKVNENVKAGTDDK